MGERGARHSALHDEHAALGAKFVDFGGWEMPLSYPTGTVAEHLACRHDAALFDVSHLGTVRLEGPGSFDLLQRTLTNDLSAVAPGRAQYTHLLREDGSVADDLIVWWLDDQVFDVMPNASNTSSVRSVLGGTDTTATRAVLALQGPRARARLAPLAPEAAAVGRFHVTATVWEGVPLTAAGTGYTGEDGVECAVPAEAAPAFFRALLGAGFVAAGLGARDTLRLEAGLPLHGHELGPGITPLQAGLSWVVAFAKEAFVGKEALEAERAAGVARKLRGLLAEGRQPPRHGDAVSVADRHLGTVTSGNFSPVLKAGIGLALLATDAGLKVGDPVVAQVRGKQLALRVHALPFYRRPGA